jgi:hypothetical protein
MDIAIPEELKNIPAPEGGTWEDWEAAFVSDGYCWTHYLNEREWKNLRDYNPTMMSWRWLLCARRRKSQPTVEGWLCFNIDPDAHGECPMFISRKPFVVVCGKHDPGYVCWVTGATAVWLNIPESAWPLPGKCKRYTLAVEAVAE